ncbi:hypothetical protein ATANTOWER_002207 [Ataeniobius toweri]|uniref:Uncharacterized protein n=1 Tax=Ataeniobius toweri TaxID=208326 RepID=A0ABU7BX16_9TELE|nr:hypothetical protein [Ataeniobius toweri]
MSSWEYDAKRYQGGSPAGTKPAFATISCYNLYPSAKKKNGSEIIRTAATVNPRRAMKGHTNFLPAVHRESICLTPDTFHSTSCPTRAVDATSNFSPQILTSNTWKVTNRNAHKICTLSKCLSGLKKVFFPA